MFTNKLKIIPFIAFHLFLSFIVADDKPKLPIGMNVSPVNYYTTAIPFMDLMKASSGLIPYNLNSDSKWSSGKIDQIQLDSHGYPIEIPTKVPNGAALGVRFLLNNEYSGDYRFLYDGEGDFDFKIKHTVQNGQVILHFDAEGDHRWINIKRSKKGNHVRNIRIIPIGVQNEAEMPVFNPLYMEGLRPFQCLRMTFFLENNTNKIKWSERTKPNDFSQGTDKGCAIEYAIAMCNELKCDAWLSMQYNADDEYIRNFATFVRDNLDPSLKIYLEYSNEVWNWGYPQSHYVLKNAPGAADQYVSKDLKSINPEQSNHNEKSAYMMQRVFRIWTEVFGEETPTRIVRIGSIQNPSYYHTGHILKYLFKKDKNGKPVSGHIYATSTGEGCDAIGTAGYFGFSKEDHERWVKMNPKDVTSDMVIEAANKRTSSTPGLAMRKNIEFVKGYNIDYLVYEGGQHMQPYQQKVWAYNHAVYDAQINPRIYDLYMKVFAKHALPEVNCKLFCLFNYMGKRKSRWGSWGHLENLTQLLQIQDVQVLAPKFAAGLDANSPK